MPTVVVRRELDLKGEGWAVGEMARCRCNASDTLPLPLPGATFQLFEYREGWGNGYYKIELGPIMEVSEATPTSVCFRTGEGVYTAAIYPDDPAEATVLNTPLIDEISA